MQAVSGFAPCCQTRACDAVWTCRSMLSQINFLMSLIMMCFVCFERLYKELFSSLLAKYNCVEKIQVRVWRRGTPPTAFTELSSFTQVVLPRNGELSWVIKRCLYLSNNNKCFIEKKHVGANLERNPFLNWARGKIHIECQSNEM